MKRIFSWLLSMAMIAALLSTAALAVGSGVELTYDLTSGNSNAITVKQGDEIPVTFTIKRTNSGEAYSVFALQNEIMYDQDFFEFVPGSETLVVGGNGFTEFQTRADGTTNIIKAATYSADYDAETIFCTFTLKVIGASGSGTVYCDEAKAYDSENQSITITEKPLTATIQGSTPVTPVDPVDPVNPVNPGTSDGIQVKVEPQGGSSYTVEFTRGSNKTPIANLDDPMSVSVSAVSGNVVRATYRDGTQVLLGKSLVENGKAYFLLNGSATVEVTDNSKRFSDVADSAWYKSAVDFASSHELFNGVSAAEFAPLTTMNRAMLVTVLYRLESEPVATAKNLFTDVADGAWYTDAVTWANANKIVEGYGDGRFGPMDNVTREQMAAILYRYMQYLDMDVSARGSLSAFPDGNQVSAWAKEAVQWAVGGGIITGRDSGVLDPTGTATRAEVATMLMRLVALMVK